MDDLTEWDADDWLRVDVCAFDLFIVEFVLLLLMLLLL